MSKDRLVPPTGGNPIIEERLETLWLALEEGRVGDALEQADALVAEYPEDGDVALGMAAATYEAGAVHETLEAAQRAGELGASDRLLQRWYVAAAHHYLWRFEEARDELESLVREEQEFGEAWFLLAQVCEMQGDEVGARRGYERAFALEPERFPRPMRVDEAFLEAVIAEAGADLPPQFQEALDELAVVPRDLPTHEMAGGGIDNEDALPPDLLGLFVGTDQLDRSVFNPVDHPGVIFLFQRNLERVCPDRDTLVEEIRTTLWHELAHYLGFEEDQMADLGLE